MRELKKRLERAKFSSRILAMHQKEIIKLLRKQKRTEKELLETDKCLNDDDDLLNRAQEILLDLNLGNCEIRPGGYCIEHSWHTEDGPCPGDRAERLLAELND